MNRFHSSLVAALLLAAPAIADVSMSEAIGIAGKAVSNRTLVEVSLHDDEGVWRVEFVNAALTNVLEVDINAVTGAIVDQDLDSIDPDDAVVYARIFSDPQGLVVGFVEAVEAASAVAPQGNFPSYAEIDIEAGILAYSVEFWPSGAKYYVDAATGVVASYHDDDGADSELLQPAVLLASIDAAVAASGLPVLSAEAEDEHWRDGRDAAVVEVLQWDAETGEVLLAVVDAATSTVISSTRFVPSGSQMARLQPVISALPLVTRSYASAIDAALVAHPGALGIHEVSLEIEGGGIFIEVELVNAVGIEIDVLVDATAMTAAASRASVAYHPCDYNLDGRVDGTDLAELLAAWGSMNPLYDWDGDQQVTGVELGALLAAWN